MKKIIALIMAAALVLSFAACGQKPETEEPVEEPQSSEAAEESQKEAEAQLIDEKTIDEGIAKCLEMHDKVISETFGADIDYDDAYYRLYEEGIENPNDWVTMGLISEDVMMGLEPDKNYQKHYAGYLVDPSEGRCTTVRDYSSMDDIRNEFSKYLNPEIFEQILEDNFIDYDGVCYLVRGGRGYGAESVGEVEITEKTDNTVKAKADLILFDEVFGYFDFTFSVDSHREIPVMMEAADEVMANSEEVIAG